MEVTHKWVNDSNFNATIETNVLHFGNSAFTVSTKIGSQLTSRNLFNIMKSVEELHIKIICTHFNIEENSIQIKN